MRVFSIHKMYVKMMGPFQKVAWRRLWCNNLGHRLWCNNLGHPKWLFILLLDVHEKLYTKDRLMRWGIIKEQTCSLCTTTDESLKHLFFECQPSRHIWYKLLQWQVMNRQILPWQDEVNWANTHDKGKSASLMIYKMPFFGCIYVIWRERNHRVFQAKRSEADDLVMQVIQEVFVRSRGNTELASRL
ncbi:uncharacterized protein LOC132038096 [Lycium ferocissimum]|uniref:uncharacterized protein LOC132038096 n=1 Tax=Lycium ferocissimum TaxID=112874 RepID=UPI00281526D0|nr:uncharacterized protein LOC132038096 [Lycium ferocissimum]